MVASPVCGNWCAPPFAALLPAAALEAPLPFDPVEPVFGKVAWLPALEEPLEAALDPAPD